MPVTTSRPLCRPSLDEIVDLTRQTLAQLSLSEGRWVGEFPDRLAQEPCGRHTWSRRTEQRTTFVATLWARDYIGRLTVNVVAGTQDSGEPIRHLSEPPQAILYEEYATLYWRPGADEPETLLACPCGVIGRLEEIAWIGNSCGPCHDRHEAGERLPAPLGRVYRRLDAPELGAGTTFEMLNDIWSPGLPLTSAPTGELLVARRNGPYEHSGDINEIALWDESTERLTRTWPTSAPVYNACFLKNNFLALVLGDGERDHLEILRLDTGQVVHRLDLPVPVYELAIATDGQTLYLGLDTGIVRLDRDTGTLRPVMKFRASSYPYVLACSSDGQTLATVEATRPVTLLDPAGGTIRARTRTFVPETPVGMVFSPDDRTLFVAQQTGQVTLFRVPNLVCLGTVRANSHAVHAVQILDEWLVQYHSQPDAVSRWPRQPLLEYLRRDHERKP